MKTTKLTLLAIAIAGAAQWVSANDLPLQANASLPVEAQFGLGQPSSIEQIPRSQLRQTIESLPLVAQQNALRWLQELDFPASDVLNMRADETGAIYYVDTLDIDLLEPITEPQATPVSAADPGQVFYLHSRPGASRTVYLDFDGHVISGTAWNGSGGPDYFAVPFDRDGSPNSFNQDEINRIAEIWHRVAEDFAAFDIDVTTEEPSNFGPNVGRILITKDVDANGVAMPAQGAGGVAYVGVWGRSNYSYYSPALVYYNRLGSGYPAYVAAAASHELGHNLSLSHDGTVASGSEPATNYYNGHGNGYVSWGPIMGSGYYSSITTWSNGDYANANNTQDDLAILEGHLTLRDDDHGDSIATASFLQVDSDGTVSSSHPENDAHNSQPNNKGVIGSSVDRDVFAIDSGDGLLTITVQPAWQAFYLDNLRGANLDVSLRLLNQNGTVLAAANPTNETQATIQANVSAGTVYLEVSATDNPVVPYSSYAINGMYFIDGSVPIVNLVPNSDPLAVDDNFTLSEDMAAVLALTNNDSDPDGDLISILSVSAPQHGTTSLTDGQVAYQPAANYHGSDSFTYTIGDGRGGASSATVTLSVSSINDAPIAANDSLTTDAGVRISIFVLNNDSDPDGDTLSLLQVGTASNGQVEISGNSVVYTPNAGFVGNDSFTYTISDGDLSDSATVSVRVTAPPLSVPQNLSVGVSPDGSAAILMWNDVSAADGYDIERESLHKNGSRWVDTASLSSSTASYQDQPGAGTYRYRVRAVSGADLGPWSPYVEGVTLVDAGGSGGGGKPSGGGKGGKNR